jgi:hypothetical protein
MKTNHVRDEDAAVARNLDSLTGSHRRTLDAIFHHPTPHNLEWSDVVALIGKIGDVQEESDNRFVLTVAGKTHHVRKPHTKDLPSNAVLDLRHFLMEAEYSPTSAENVPHSEPASPDLVIVVDHHGTKIFKVDAATADAAEPAITPYDPHHFLHHLTHKDQDRERGQRAPEEPAYYEKVAAAVVGSGRLVIVGHGSGKSNAAHHLAEYLKSHHHEIYQRVVRELQADLSAVTEPQLLKLAKEALSG